MRSRQPILSLVLVALIAVAVLPAGSSPANAQETDLFVLQGRLLDAEDDPIAGCRVVFREFEATEVYLSKPSAADGTFAVAVPAGKRYLPIAVLGAGGQRVPLMEMPAIEARAGADLDIRLLVPLNNGGAYEPRPFPGADRLFLAFVEDTAATERFRFENELRISERDAYDEWVSELRFSIAPASIPQVEFGARVGYAGLDLASGLADSSGVNDLEAWARYALASPTARGARFSFGALVTLPTGDEDDGLGAGAFRSKLFAAGRWDVALVTVAAHAGLRINEDGEWFGIPLEGEIAPAAGLAVIYPLTDRWVLVGEAAFEGKRFDGGDSEAVVLGGVNWEAFFGGSVRAALGVGLADGSPDTQFRVGYAVDF